MTATVVAVEEQVSASAPAWLVALIVAVVALVVWLNRGRR